MYISPTAESFRKPKQELSCLESYAFLENWKLNPEYTPVPLLPNYHSTYKISSSHLHKGQNSISNTIKPDIVVTVTFLGTTNGLELLQEARKYAITLQ